MIKKSMFRFAPEICVHWRMSAGSQKLAWATRRQGNQVRQLERARGPALSGCEHQANFLDPLSAYLRVSGWIYPACKVPALKRSELVPLNLRLRCACKGFVKIYRHKRKAAGTPLSRGKPTRDALDPTFTCFWLFGRVYPHNKVLAGERREITPLSLRFRRSRKDFAKVRWHSGLWFFSFHGLDSNLNFGAGNTATGRLLFR